MNRAPSPTRGPSEARAASKHGGGLLASLDEKALPENKADQAEHPAPAKTRVVQSAILAEGHSSREMSCASCPTRGTSEARANSNHGGRPISLGECGGRPTSLGEQANEEEATGTTASKRNSEHGGEHVLSHATAANEGGGEGHESEEGNGVCVSTRALAFKKKNPRGFSPTMDT